MIDPNTLLKALEVSVEDLEASTKMVFETQGVTYLTGKALETAVPEAVIFQKQLNPKEFIIAQVTDYIKEAAEIISKSDKLQGFLTSPVLIRSKGATLFYCEII